MQQGPGQAARQAMQALQQGSGAAWMGLYCAVLRRRVLQMAVRVSKLMSSMGLLLAVVMVVCLWVVVGMVEVMVCLRLRRSVPEPPLG